MNEWMDERPTVARACKQASEKSSCAKDQMQNRIVSVSCQLNEKTVAMVFPVKLTFLPIQNNIKMHKYCRKLTEQINLPEEWSICGRFFPIPSTHTKPHINTENTLVLIQLAKLQHKKKASIVVAIARPPARRLNRCSALRSVSK